MEKKKLYILLGVLALALIIFLVAVVIRREDRMGVDDGTAFRCGNELAYQGHNYATVQIGNQCWMAENLRAVKYRNEEPIANLISGTEWAETQGGAYSCYQNNEEQCNVYGALYNWHAVNNPSGLCPQGWSVPTHNQWTDLERSVCEALGNENCNAQFSYNGIMGYAGTNEGQNLKSQDAGGTDAYKFAGLFGGFRNSNGPFSLIGERGFFWSSTPSGEFAYGRLLDHEEERIRRFESHKLSGFSVRCLMD